MSRKTIIYSVGIFWILFALSHFLAPEKSHTTTEIRDFPATTNPVLKELLIEYKDTTKKAPAIAGASNQIKRYFK